MSQQRGAQSESPMPLRLLRLADVKARVGMSRSTIYDRIAKGDFPRPVPLGTIVGWVESEVEDWILERIKQRGSK